MVKKKVPGVATSKGHADYFLEHEQTITIDFFERDSTVDSTS